MARKHRTGHLFKRGSYYHLRWIVEGKVFTKALRDEQHLPITTKEKAEAAQQREMAAFVVGDEASALESLVGKLEGRRAEVAKFEEEKNPPLRVEGAWEWFLDCPNRPDSGEETLYQYQCQWSQFERWLREERPGVVTLREVSKGVAGDYASYLRSEGVSPNTYNKHLNLLTLVFRVLKDKARIGENVWAEIPRKRLVTQSRRELTVEELRRVCQQATGELRTLLALGVYSGLRLGDCATLRWCEVDLARGVIRRVPNKTARRNPKPVIVPMHGVLREMLGAMAAAGERSEYVLPEIAGLYGQRTDAVTDLVQRHFIACGVDVWKPGTGPKARDATGKKVKGKRAVVEVGFHSLRHTFVSLCRESNAPLAVVESIVGHSNPAMTRHYTHVGELAAGQAVAALPFVIGEEKVEKPKVESGNGAEAMLRQVRTLLEGMTLENWQAKRTEALEIVGSALGLKGGPGAEAVAGCGLPVAG